MELHLIVSCLGNKAENNPPFLEKNYLTDFEMCLLVFFLSQLVSYYIICSAHNPRPHLRFGIFITNSLLCLPVWCMIFLDH